MRRTTTIVVATAAAAVLGAGTASAGEITGNGKDTKAPANGNSACLYSGLDDPDPDPFDRTQNYGQIIRLLGVEMGMQMAPSPGEACNPTRGFHE